MKKSKAKPVNQEGVVCCDMMRFYAFEHEDQLITYVPAFRQFRLTVPEDLGGGGIVIDYCPWCGAKLPESLEKKWFRQVRTKLGFEDAFPFTKEIPSESKTDE